MTLGLILLILGIVVAFLVHWVLGIIIALIGAALLIAAAVGRT